VDGGTSHAAGRHRIVALVVLCAALCSVPASGQEPVAPGRATDRLRPTDAKAATLLQAGAARSATFRSLVDAIEQSDLVVYVETRQLTLPGQLQFVSATPGGRYVRVSVRVQGRDDELLPWLAHELWHAVEIAGAPEVRDRTGLLRFYEHTGGGFRAGNTKEMETVAAQRVQARVDDELRRGRR
jgi:hypothetical protein